MAKSPSRTAFARQLAKELRKNPDLFAHLPRNPSVRDVVQAFVAPGKATQERVKRRKKRKAKKRAK